MLLHWVIGLHETKLGRRSLREDDSHDHAIEAQGLAEDENQNHAHEDCFLLSVGADTCVTHDADSETSSLKF